MIGMNANCKCGHVEFKIEGDPLFRLFCHCTLCQSFNGAPFADVLVYKAAQISEPRIDSVKYTALKPPPNVQRGKCVECHAPAIEKFVAPLLPKLTIVPAAVHSDVSALADSVAHIFYDKRVIDSADSLPKYSGFMWSQFAFGKLLLTSKKH